MSFLADKLLPIVGKGLGFVSKFLQPAYETASTMPSSGGGANALVKSDSTKGPGEQSATWKIVAWIGGGLALLGLLFLIFKRKR